MALGLAGAEMQTILNTLASPFTLGVSSAAARRSAGDCSGHRYSRRSRKRVYTGKRFFFLRSCPPCCSISLDPLTRVPTSGVVLFGIVLVFTFNALVSIMQFVADTLQGLVFWTMGQRLARASWEKLAVLAAAMAIVLPWSLRRARKATPRRRAGDEFWH